MAKKIADISHHHPVKDWSKAKSSCSFLISKATQGTSYIDSTLKSFISGCEENRIPYWLYVYLNKGNEKAQAEFMIKTCKGKVGNYFIGYILDVEAGNTATNVQTALKYLNELGYKTMLYTMYADYTKYKTVISNRGSNCAWWEARYGLNNGSYSSKYPCHSGVDLHQYTSVGSCDGLTGKVDLNRITGNGKTLDWFITPLKSSNSSSTNSSTTVTNSNSYYNKYTGTSSKIDEVFKAIGVPSTLYGNVTKRKSIASANGISNYTGTASQNLTLISLAKKGTLKKPTSVSYYSKYTGSSTKIDTVLKAIGVPSSNYGSVAKRKTIATANGITGYTGTSSQNLKLISLAKSGKLKKV